jgi:hypothetical protein
MVENAVQARTVAARGERGVFAKRAAGEKGSTGWCATKALGGRLRGPDGAHWPGSVPGFAA